MEVIDNGATVFVCTGYSDCQMQMEGFTGKVIDRRGNSYLIRRRNGDVLSCRLGEFELVSKQNAYRLPEDVNLE